MPEEDFTGMYCLMLSDAVSFEHAIRAGLEGGPTSKLRVRTVTYYYLRADEREHYWDHRRMMRCRLSSRPFGLNAP